MAKLLRRLSQHLLRLDRLELFLLDLGLQLRDCVSFLLIDSGLALDLIGQIVNCLPVLGQLFVELLFEAAHKGVHHHVAVLLDIEFTIQPTNFS